MKLVYKNLLLALALCSATTQAMQTRQTIQSPLEIVFCAGLAAVGIYRASNARQENSISNTLENSQDMLVAIEPDYERFFEAAKAGNVSVVRGFIKLGADVNKANGYGETSLSWAAYFGHKDVVQLLIQAKADVNKANIHGNTSLYRAACFGYKKIVQLLIQAKADINKADNNGYTPLYRAAYFGYGEIVKLLVEGNAIIDQGTIDIARNQGHVQIAQNLEQIQFNSEQLNKNGIRLTLR